MRISAESQRAYWRNCDERNDETQAPHNGAVVTLLGICGLTHREAYKDIFMVAVAFPILALVLIVTLGTLFGAF